MFGIVNQGGVVKTCILANSNNDGSCSICDNFSGGGSKTYSGGKYFCAGNLFYGIFLDCLTDLIFPE